MIENMKIESVSLGIEDHGILTAFIHLVGDGCGQGFGGYAMDRFDKAKDRRVGHAFCADFLLGLFAALEVHSWEKLPGVVVRVERDRPYGTIMRIGHAFKDKWFNPKAVIESYGEA